MTLQRILQESNKEFFNRLDKRGVLTNTQNCDIIYSYYKDRDEEFWLEDLNDNDFRSSLLDK